MRRVISPLIICICAISCSINEIEIVDNANAPFDVFYATVESSHVSDAPVTKVYIDEDVKILWNQDDRILIFNKVTYNQEYRFKGSTGDNAGGFAKVDNDDFATGNKMDYILSVYPFMEETSISNKNVLSLNLPSEQKYSENSFGLGANVMVSATDDNFLQFKNIGGYLVLKFYGSDVSISSIKLEGNNGEPLSGKGTLTPSVSEVPIISMSSTAGTSVSLTCDEPITIGKTKEESTIFWLVVPPTVFSNGFTLTVKDSEGGVFVKTTNKALSINRNGVLRISPIEVITVQTETTLQLDRNELSLTVGGSEALTASVTPANKSVCWFSSNESIATVDENGNVTANGVGFATITALCDKKISTCEITVGYPSIPEVVDLGLSVKWSSFNVGATRPEEVGSKFAWGEVSEKPAYAEANYQWYDNVNDDYFKYSTETEWISTSLGYQPSGITLLESQDDAASVALGVNWRIPTCDEFQELIDKCSWEMITMDYYEGFTAKAIEGYKITGPNGNSIFLPQTIGSSGNPQGYYRCSDLVRRLSGTTYYMSCESLYFFAAQSTSNGVTTWKSTIDVRADNHRYVGRHIRAVFDSDIESRQGIILSKRQLDIRLGESETLVAKSFSTGHGIQKPTWCSSDERIVKVDASGKLTPVFYGSATVTAEYEGQTASCEVSVLLPAEYVDPEPVDMGLSVKWASYNLGATSPSETGFYYPWGEITPKGYYDWEHYKWSRGTKKTITKYCLSSDYGCAGICDNKAYLQRMDDAAFRNLGGNWRTPTTAEYKELIDNCEWHESSDGELCVAVSKINGNLIRFPKSGYIDDETKLVNKENVYCRSTRSSTSSAYSFCFRNHSPYYPTGSSGIFDRPFGVPVRPVSD